MIKIDFMEMREEKKSDRERSDTLMTSVESSWIEIRRRFCRDGFESWIRRDYCWMEIGFTEMGEFDADKFET